MSLLDNYEPPAPRSLPVVLLLDTSGSMQADDKIEVLNDSVLEMIDELRAADGGLGCITLSVITFGGDSAHVLHAHEPIAQVTFTRLVAAGRTPLGAAFHAAQQLIEDTTALTNRSYRATLALVSDGIPTDNEWKERLDDLTTCERGSKATRYALAIGADADRDLLTTFTGGQAPSEAGEAAEIRKFLQFVTTKVTDATRTAMRSGDVPAQADRVESILRLTADDAF